MPLWSMDTNNEKSWAAEQLAHADAITSNIQSASSKRAQIYLVVWAVFSAFCDASYEAPLRPSTSLETCQFKNIHQRLCTLSFSVRPSVGRAAARAASSILRLGLFHLFASQRLTWLIIQMRPNVLPSQQLPQ